MYFMLGGHPAFKTPEGLTVHDFTLDFHRKNEDGPLHYQAPSSKGYQGGQPFWRNFLFRTAG